MFLNYEFAFPVASPNGPAVAASARVRRRGGSWASAGRGSAGRRSCCVSVRGHEGRAGGMATGKTGAGAGGGIDTEMREFLSTIESSAKKILRDHNKKRQLEAARENVSAASGRRRARERAGLLPRRVRVTRVPRTSG